MRRVMMLLCAILGLALLVLADSAWACGLSRGRGRCDYAGCGACYGYGAAYCGPGGRYKCPPVCCPMGPPYAGGYIPADMIPPLPPKPPTPPAAPVPPKPAAPTEPMGPGVTPQPPTPAEPTAPAPPKASVIQPEDKAPMPSKTEPSTTPPAPPGFETPKTPEKPKADVPAPGAMPLLPPVPTEKKAEAPPKPTASNGPILRVWTDLSGMHRVVARFVGVLDGGTVRLQQLDGAYLRVALDQLSAADQNYVSAQRTALAAN